MVWICIKIFFARILDVSIATIRQNVMLKGHYFKSTILAFMEIFIWFLVAREALTVGISSLWIPISYSLGYATGTLLGSLLSKKFIKGEVGVQVIIDEAQKELISALKLRGYSFNILHLESGFKSEPKLMIFIEVNNKSVKKLQALIEAIVPDAFIVISDTKQIINGTLK